MIKTHNIIILLTGKHKHTLDIVCQGNETFSDKEFKAMCIDMILDMGRSRFGGTFTSTLICLRQGH